MDRIFYFYTAREQAGDTPPCKAYRYVRREYELVRVGLAPWFIKSWEAAEKKEVHNCEKKETGLSFLYRIRQKRLRQRQREEQISLWELQFGHLLLGIWFSLETAGCEVKDGRERLKGGTPGLREAFLDGGFADGTKECWFSCEEKLMPLLLPKKELASDESWNALGAMQQEGTDNPAPRKEEDSLCREVWQRMWRIPFFENYMEAKWVEYMLQYAALPHYLILGFHSKLPEFLEKHASRMKSLQWILPERFYDERLQNFMEEFYDEYGIAAGVQILEAGQSYRQARTICREPTNILDFSGEEIIPTGEIAKDSIWLDMASVEEKSRRVEGRKTGIHYFSLKKEWKRPILP